MIQFLLFRIGSNSSYVSRMDSRAVNVDATVDGVQGFRFKHHYEQGIF